MGKTIITGLCLGLPLLFVKIVFRIPSGLFWKYYPIRGGIAVVGTVAFSLLYNRRYLRKMQATAHLLEFNRVEKYVTEMESVRYLTKGHFANCMLTINLSAGYCKLKQYDKTAELLESISDVELSGGLELIYHLNPCLCYFYQRQTSRTVTLYENSQRILNPYQNSKLYGGSITVLDIYAAIGHKDYTRIVKLLQTTRNTWGNPRFLDDYCYLEENTHWTQ